MAYSTTGSLFSKSPTDEISEPSAPLAERMRPRSLDEFAGQSHLVGEGRILRRLLEGSANLPSLILWGAQDALIPVAAGHKLNALIKRSKLVTFDNCGHLPQEEMPARTIEEVTRFIAGQNPGKK